MIDARHELVTLSALIDWEFFEREWATFFPSHQGRPATSPRLVAGLMYLQHAFKLSDEAVVARLHRNLAVLVDDVERALSTPAAPTRPRPPPRA